MAFSVNYDKMAKLEALKGDDPAEYQRQLDMLSDEQWQHIKSFEPIYKAEKRSRSVIDTAKTVGQAITMTNPDGSPSTEMPEKGVVETLMNLNKDPQAAGMGHYADRALLNFGKGISSNTIPVLAGVVNVAKKALTGESPLLQRHPQEGNLGSWEIAPDTKKNYDEGRWETLKRELDASKIPGAEGWQLAGAITQPSPFKGSGFVSAMGRGALQASGNAIGTGLSEDRPFGETLDNAIDQGKKGAAFGAGGAVVGQVGKVLLGTAANRMSKALSKAEETHYNSKEAAELADSMLGDSVSSTHPYFQKAIYNEVGSDPVAQEQALKFLKSQASENRINSSLNKLASEKAAALTNIGLNAKGGLKLPEVKESLLKVIPGAEHVKEGFNRTFSPANMQRLIQGGGNTLSGAESLISPVGNTLSNETPDAGTPAPDTSMIRWNKLLGDEEEKEGGM